jgi:hypothetical protein
MPLESGVGVYQLTMTKVSHERYSDWLGAVTDPCVWTIASRTVDADRNEEEVGHSLVETILDLMGIGKTTALRFAAGRKVAYITKGSLAAPLAIDSPLAGGNGHPSPEPRLQQVCHMLIY